MGPWVGAAAVVEPAGFDWSRVVFAGAVVLAILALLVLARCR